MNSLSPDWENFFTAEMGALAALTGLVVVAISINLSRILAIASLPKRAGEALMILMAALIIVSLVLIPAQPAVLLGFETLAIGLIAFFVPATSQVRSWGPSEGVNLTKKLLRLSISSGAILPFVVAGVLLILGTGGAFYWVAAGVIVSLVAGVWNSWILLVEILR